MGLGSTAVSMLMWSAGFIAVNAILGPVYLRGQNMLAGRTATAVPIGGGY